MEQAIRTMVETAHDLSKIEVILGMDDDDEQGLAGVEEIRKKYPGVEIRINISKQSENFVNTYSNPLAKLARGRWILNISDDVIFITPKWDWEILSRMNKKASGAGDDLFFGLVKDGLMRIGEDTRFPNFTCWPVLSKRHVDVLGYMYPPFFIMNGADHFIAEVYRKLGRSVSLTHVFIDHDSPHTMKRPHDEDWFRIQGINERNSVTYTKEHVEQEVLKLAGFIGR